MARPRTGQLIWRNSWAFARVTTIIDGEKVRVMKALGTQNPVVARKKLDKLNAAESPATEDVKRAETFAEAAERVFMDRHAEGSQYALDELGSLKLHVLPVIGAMSVSKIDIAGDINIALASGKKAGLSRGSVQHLRQRIGAVFAQLESEPGGPPSPMAKVVMPRFTKSVKKERAVLTDAELAIYLAWAPASEGFRSIAVLERQTMACVARMFGGLRTSDLHALKWDGFDVEHGAFGWGWAPRKKTSRPQMLEVPEMLRQILRAWWERHGGPAAGVVFPVRRRGRGSDRVGQERVRTSHARALRRDLQRAFGAAGDREGVPRPGSRRWQELFERTSFTLPVDFHSWRRAYAQALADADVNAQQAAALTGHSSLAVHAQYLRSAGKMRKLPDAALPSLPESALAKGSAAVLGGIGGVYAAIVDQESAPKYMAKAGPPDFGSDGRGFESLRARQKVGEAEIEKALAMPKPTEATPIPARPAVRLLDLLAAIDAAILAGDAHAARSLVAEATRLERERSSKGDSQALGSADSP